MIPEKRIFFPFFFFIDSCRKLLKLWPACAHLVKQ